MQETQIFPNSHTLFTTLLYFIGSAILSFLLAPIIIHLLYKLNIRRQPKGDKASELFDIKGGKVGTPIMGGLIIIITTLIITITFNWSREYTWVPVGAFVLSACIGGIDDLLNIFGKNRDLPKPLRLHIKLAFVHKYWRKRVFYFMTIPWAAFKRLLLFLGSKPKSGLQVHEKILLQTFVGATVGYWIYYKLEWSEIWIPFLNRYSWIMEPFEPILHILGITLIPEYSVIDIGWLIIPFIILTIVTVSNAVNISDGMDGLAGGLAFIAFIAYTVIGSSISEYSNTIGKDVINLTTYYGSPSLAYLSATVAGSLLAYLYFNVKPARLQMGDVGSLAIGTLLSIIAIILNREFTLLFIAGVFLINSVFSLIIQRVWLAFTGKKLFHMIPLHYHFALKGWPEEKVVMRFWIISILLTTIGIIIALS
ncbi:MAG: hypothetical protein KatS3mg084_0149 [Candidatus Dojkabacteria bacterium]|nr:MAG: hypothetical protein KatS3mg084_0149 [Candidatus Dojkabacteria bacterium]